LIASSRKFTVSVLHQQASPELIGTFGYKTGREVSKFDSINSSTTPAGTPVVMQDTVAWFDCEVVTSVDVGSHLLFIGKVLDCEMLDERHIPLTYSWYREVKKGFSPKNAPTYVDPEKYSRKTEISSSSLKKYKCLACNYVYDPQKGDPDSGIAPGTAFEDIPEDWICPVCGATKEMFEEVPG
jgi:rubredoxin